MSADTTITIKPVSQALVLAAPQEDQKPVAPKLPDPSAITRETSSIDAAGNSAISAFREEIRTLQQETAAENSRKTKELAESLIKAEKANTWGWLTSAIGIVAATATIAAGAATGNVPLVVLGVALVAMNIPDKKGTPILTKYADKGIEKISCGNKNVETTLKTAYLVTQIVLPIVAACYGNTAAVANGNWISSLKTITTVASGGSTTVQGYYTSQSLKSEAGRSVSENRLFNLRDRASRLLDSAGQILDAITSCFKTEMKRLQKMYETQRKLINNNT
jgi:hypothetical protein